MCCIHEFTIFSFNFTLSEAHKPASEDVFMDEDEAPKVTDQERKDEAGGWTEVKDSDEDELPVNEKKEEIVPDNTIHEVAVGKGLSGALQLLKERGTLKEGIEWGGRNMDKKKSKLVGINDNTGPKEIRIERTDEFGRIVSAFFLDRIIILLPFIIVVVNVIFVLYFLDIVVITLYIYYYGCFFW